MNRLVKGPYFYLGLILVFLIAYYPLFHSLGSLPIVLWDESRLANNAFEMYTSGNWLVMQYDGQPDYWNAKPPLMIWLQTISLKIFGMTEFAIRLPSAIAGLLTCFLLYWFFAKKQKAPVVGILACLILISSIGYVKVHTARTGDFDTLLTLFTTAYGIFFYLYLDEQKKKYLYLTFLAITCAVMTKGIAGMILFPAFFFYALYKRQVLYLLKSPHFYIGVVMFVGLVFGFYFLRDYYDPGYIDAMIENEITDRFFREGKNANHDFWYYYNFLKHKDFRPWYKLIVPGTLLGIFLMNKRWKDITVFALLFALVQFLVVSNSGSKAEWYAMPSYPYFTILAAIGIFGIIYYIRRLRAGSVFTKDMVCLLLLVILFGDPIWKIHERKINTELGTTNDEHLNMGYYMKKVMKNPDADNITIVHDDYQADILWYVKVLQYKGRNINTVHVDSLGTYHKNIIAYQKTAKEKLENNYVHDKELVNKNIMSYRLYERK